MAEFPALTLWTDAYLSDTRLLTTMEHGAYLLLLMEAWRRPNCDLPDDDKMLARMTGLAADEWAGIKSTIMSFWNYDGRSKMWKQKRLTKERDSAKKRSKSQADKATKRWSKTEKDDAAAMPEGCPDTEPGNARTRAFTATATATAIKSSEEANASPAADAAKIDPVSDPDKPDEPPPRTAIDVVKVIFDTGLAILVAAGSPESQARSTLGRWRKIHGNAAVLTVLARCQTEGPEQPVEWITKALQAETRQASGQANGQQQYPARESTFETGQRIADELFPAVGAG